jgi:hypothetical protein
MRPAWRAVGESHCLRQGILAEGLDLRPGQLPTLAGEEVAERKLADRHTLQLMDLVAEVREHAANLTVLPLVEDHLEDGALLVLRLEVDMLSPCHPLGEPDATAEFVDRLRGGHTGHLNEVFFLDSIPGVGAEIGQFTVVGDEDQPFAHPVEPADGEQTLVAGHEIDDAWSAIGVEVRGHHANGLGEHVHDPLRVRQTLAVDADLLTERIDAGAELGDDLAIDLDPACRDQFLAISPASEPGCRQHLLQAFETVVLAGGGRMAESAPRCRLLTRFGPCRGPGSWGATRRDPRPTAAIRFTRPARFGGRL